MGMSENRSNFKRTNLFLLRVWCDDADEDGEESEGSCRVWHGVVQRTVSGETHNFEAKDDLIEVLEAMIYKDRKDAKGRQQQTRPRGKLSTETGLPPRGDNQTERPGVDEQIR
jgi:hypothetical protein